jgi:hypothetical protein
MYISSRLLRSASKARLTRRNCSAERMRSSQCAGDEACMSGCHCLDFSRYALRIFCIDAPAPSVSSAVGCRWVVWRGVVPTVTGSARRIASEKGAAPQEPHPDPGAAFRGREPWRTELLLTTWDAEHCPRVLVHMLAAAHPAVAGSPDGTGPGHQGTCGCARPSQSPRHIPDSPSRPIHIASLGVLALTGALCRRASPNTEPLRVEP